MPFPYCGSTALHVNSRHSHPRLPHQFGPHHTCPDHAPPFLFCLSGPIPSYAGRSRSASTFRIRPCQSIPVCRAIPSPCLPIRSLPAGPFHATPCLAISAPPRLDVPDLGFPIPNGLSSLLHSQSLLSLAALPLRGAPLQDVPVLCCHSSALRCRPCRSAPSKPAAPRPTAAPSPYLFCLSTSGRCVALAAHPFLPILRNPGRCNTTPSLAANVFRARALLSATLPICPSCPNLCDSFLFCHSASIRSLAVPGYPFHVCQSTSILPVPHRS